MTRLIDVDALEKAIYEWMPKDQETWMDSKIPPIENLVVSIMMTIQEQPTVDAEPVRHGRFIGTEYDGYADGNPVYYEWKCSECGCVFEDEEPTYNYCPNCGADMKGENNE